MPPVLAPAPVADPLAALDMPRVPLGASPTPVRRLEVGAAGAQLWLKDDGAFAPHGGNKARKLEWLLAEAERRGAKTIVSGGAIGTNHGLAVARYAGDLGIRTVLVLVPQPEDDRVRAQLARIRESGAEVHLAPNPAAAAAVGAREVARAALRDRSRPILMPPGGSTAAGCLGYVEAALELGRQVRDRQLPEPQRVVVAVGSGGTAAGLLLGLRLAGLRSRLTGVLVNDLTPMSARSISGLARRTAMLLRRRGAPVPAFSLSARDLDLRREWLGEGYGHPTEAGGRASEELAAHGLSLEPVYTAKAAAAALDLRRESGSGPVLYWHTWGGAGDAG